MCLLYMFVYYCLLITVSSNCIYMYVHLTEAHGEDCLCPTMLPLQRKSSKEFNLFCTICMIFGNNRCFDISRMRLKLGHMGSEPESQTQVSDKHLHYSGGPILA